MDTPAFDIGFCWIFPGMLPEEGLLRLRNYGFDGIELWPVFLQEWGSVRWAAALRATGMKALQLCPYFDFMKGAEGIAKSRAVFDEFLTIARVVDAKRLRVFTGPPWGEGVVGARDATEVQWRDAIGTLREFCDAAFHERIELCLECHEGSLMEDGVSALRLIRGVNRSNLTTNLQIPFKTEPWDESLSLLATTTTHVHIHNWTSPAEGSQLTYLGDGFFDWEPVVRTLIAAGSKTWSRLALSVEHADHEGRHDPWETARREGLWLRELRTKMGS